MAYDPNFPFGYTPYYQQKQAQNVYAFVNGLEGAKSYMVPANQTVLLMDSEQPVCYMKTANALGQGTLRYFKLQEVNEADIRKANPSVEFATKEDIENILKRLDGLEKHE